MSEPFLNRIWLHLLNLQQPMFNPDADAASQRYCSIQPPAYAQNSTVLFSSKELHSIGNGHPN